MRPLRIVRPLTPKRLESTPLARMPALSEDLVGPVACPGALAHDLAPQTRDLAQLPEVGRQHQAGRAEPELTDAGEPDAVGDVGLPSPDLLDMLGMQQHGLHARPGQGIVNGFPVDPGGFHRGSHHLMGEEPVGEGCDATGQRTEHPGEGLGLVTWLSQAYRGGELHLVDIDTRRPGVDDIQAVRGFHRMASVSRGDDAQAGGPTDESGLAPPRGCGAVCCASSTSPEYGSDEPGTGRGSKPLAWDSLGTGSGAP